MGSLLRTNPAPIPPNNSEMDIVGSKNTAQSQSVPRLIPKGMMYREGAKKPSVAKKAKQRVTDEAFQFQNGKV